MLRVILAEDDSAMRLVLKRVLQKIPDIEIIGETGDGREVVSMAERIRPDVIFLDIDLPGMSGIEAAREIFEINPRIYLVFATAFNSFTHEAFEVYAFDYLVKPFELNRVKQTMKRILEIHRRLDTGERYPSCGLSEKSRRKLAVDGQDVLSLINVEDIVMITRNARKTVIYTIGETYITTETLNRLEELLRGSNFFRCHKGFIINSGMVTEILPWGAKTYMVKLANTKETALMTWEKVREYQKKFCMG